MPETTYANIKSLLVLEEQNGSTTHVIYINRPPKNVERADVAYRKWAGIV